MRTYRCKCCSRLNLFERQYLRELADDWAEPGSNLSVRKITSIINSLIYKFRNNGKFGGRHMRLGRTGVWKHMRNHLGLTPSGREGGPVRRKGDLSLPKITKDYQRLPRIPAIYEMPIMSRSTDRRLAIMEEGLTKDDKGLPEMTRDNQSSDRQIDLADDPVVGGLYPKREQLYSKREQLFPTGEQLEQAAHAGVDVLQVAAEDEIDGLYENIGEEFTGMIKGMAQAMAESNPKLAQGREGAKSDPTSGQGGFTALAGLARADRHVFVADLNPEEEEDA